MGEREYAYTVIWTPFQVLPISLGFIFLFFCSLFAIAILSYASVTSNKLWARESRQQLLVPVQCLAMLVRSSLYHKV